jgi:hypothetical protein
MGLLHRMRKQRSGAAFFFYGIGDQDMAGRLVFAFTDTAPKQLVPTS